MPEMLAWWNLIYILAFFFALLYAVLNALGLASDSGMGLGHAADGALEHDVPDFHVDDAAQAAAQPAAAPSALEEVLSFFGLGKVPVSVLIMTFLVTFAVVGWAANLLLRPVLVTPLAFFPLSCGAAVVLGLGGAKLLAASLGRYLKPIESAAVRQSQLVGRIGTASLPVTATFGTALVRDDYGTLHKVTCRVREGAVAIPKGHTLLLVSYVPEKRPGRRASGYFMVEPYDVPTS